MKTISLIIIIAVCFTLSFCSGCLNQQTAQPAVTQGLPTPAPSAAPTSPPATQQPAPSVTTSPPTALQTVTDSLPAEITVLPPATAVDIGIDKDRVYNTITVTFIGGPGQVLVKNVLVRVTGSDGAVEQKNIPVTNNQVSNGASVEMTGTHGPDRVEVFATMGGVVYKLKDEIMSYTYY
jgi:hypothetical protein